MTVVISNAAFFGILQAIAMNRFLIEYGDDRNFPEDNYDNTYWE